VRLARLRFGVLLIVAAAYASACARHFKASGLVVPVDRRAATATIPHDPIDGYMPAMVMPFDVTRPALLREVEPGARVEFRLEVRRRRAVIDRLNVASAAPVDAGLTQSGGMASLVPIGNPVPDFTLTSHRNEAISLTSLHGKVVVATFLYTRCPLPEYCPMLMARFRALARRFDDRLGSDLALLTISFDPKHDTVVVLKEFAGDHEVRSAAWHLLTGPMADVGRIAEMFGVEYWPEEGLITHTLQTVVIDREGRLAALVEGRQFTDRQLGDLVEEILGL
jgi:protein SCO1